MGFVFGGSLGVGAGNFVEWRYFECPETFKHFDIKEGISLNNYAW